MTIPILKALLVIVILAVMVLILLGINHIFSGNFDVAREDEESLRRDLEEKEDVITEKSVFSELLRRNK